MGRWGAEREGSNSSELPLSPPSPKPPPQAPRPLRPPIQPCRAALPLPLVQPHLIPGGGVGGGTPALAALRPWPAHSQDLFVPMAEELRAGRPHTRDGLGNPKTLGVRLAPGRRRPATRWRESPAGLSAPPRPGMAPPPVRRRSGAPSMLGLAARVPSSGAVVATVPGVAGSRLWRGTRRPAGTAGVWPGRGDAECTRRGLRQSQSCPRTLGDRCALRAEAAARALDRSCRLLPLRIGPTAGDTTRTYACPVISQTEGYAGDCPSLPKWPLLEASVRSDCDRSLLLPLSRLPSVFGSRSLLSHLGALSFSGSLAGSLATRTSSERGPPDSGCFSPEAHSWHCQLIRVYTPRYPCVTLCARVDGCARARARWPIPGFG